ncbi:MAG: leucyl aminopeptidase [bacterium]
MPAFLAHLQNDESIGADVLVVPVSSVSDLHRRLEIGGDGVADAAQRAVDLGDFAVGPGARILVHARGFERFPRVMLSAVAPGTRAAQIRADFTSLARDSVFSRADSVAVLVSSDLAAPDLEDGVAAAVDGLLQGIYQWTRATKTLARSPGRFVFLAANARDLAKVKAGIQRGRDLGESVLLSRELANTPANLCGPAELAGAAVALAEELGLKSRVLTGKGLVRERMEAVIAVGAGSARPPQFVTVEYDGGGGDWIALVGKGLVYDTGGLSLKPTASMVEMKFDKCGACSVLGALRAVVKAGVRQRVVAIVPAVENSVSGTSYRPGDVIDSRSGQTIEVLNTDAEGRLVLADALDYAVTEYRPQAILDAATLTGAAHVALSDHAAALLGNDDKVLGRVREAGDETGERVWQLPLWDVHRRDVDSPCADVKNTSAQGGGTIAGAAFLDRFVDGVPWAHLDMGNVARDRRDARVGATGFGVRLFARTLADWPVARGSRAKAPAKRAKAPAKRSAAKSRRKRG